MKNTILILFLFIITVSCKTQTKLAVPAWVPYNETEELTSNADHPSQKLRYKLIQSKLLDKNEMWVSINKQLGSFSEEDYLLLKPQIFEHDIPTLQANIKSGKLTYENLTKWYLYRIAKFENDKDRMLNAIVAINPKAVSEARRKDKKKSLKDDLIYGMPILLKDNINAKGMPTTAGASALLNNHASDAFIVERIKEKGGIILGKTNLSEWANYLCLDCPNGYSAVGGQTLNAYGRKQFDTGGSSSGSGAAMSANYAVAAVGTETSGSILSPSSKSSIVGLKPTVGLLSRSGIVPISSTLDTPGPMTRNSIDNAILLSAMSGEDVLDIATKNNPKEINYYEELKNASLKGLRFGVFKNYLADSLYKLSIEKIESLGGIAVEIEPEQIKFEDFGVLLSADMKIDLATYLHQFASREIDFRSVQDIVAFNKMDSSLRIPYGQGRFEGILKTTISREELEQIKNKLHTAGKQFFDIHMNNNQLDAILSIDNRNAGYAAAAKYPCLTIPMGYKENGEPAGLTFIARSFEETKLLKMGFSFEKASKKRKMPVNYQ